MEIGSYLEPAALKVSRLLCKQWCRIATLFLFQRAVLYGQKSAKYFKAILERPHLSANVRVISFESTYDGRFGELDLIPIVEQSDTLPLFPLPSSCDIYKHQTKFIAKLSGLDSTGSKALIPTLKEIQLSTPSIPYFGTILFINLRRIHINAESVQLPEYFTLPQLEKFHITCNTFGVEMMIAFLKRHGRLQQLCLNLRITLGPLTEELLDFMEIFLRTWLSEELVASITKNAKEEACGELRLFVKSIHEQMTSRLDEELVKQMNQGFITFFGLLMGQEREKYRRSWEEIRSAVQNHNAVEMTLVVDYQEGELPRFDS